LDLGPVFLGDEKEKEFSIENLTKFTLFFKV